MNKICLTSAAQQGFEAAASVITNAPVQTNGVSAPVPVAPGGPQ